MPPITTRLQHPARVALLLPLIALGACQIGAPQVAPEPVAAPRVDPAVVAAREALRREGSIDARTIPEHVIAVPPLLVRSTDSSLAPLGYGMADMLMTDLAQSSQLVVVERSRLDALLREMQLTETGQVDTAHAPRVGRLLGARQLVVGALHDRGNGEFGIDTRLASTVDGTVTKAVSARAPLEAIFDAEKILAFRLFDQLGVTLTPRERAAVDRRPTSNVTAILAYSRGVRDEAFGRYASAAANFRAAVVADPKFAPAQARLQQVETSQRAVSADPSSMGSAKPAESKPVNSAVALAGSAVNPSPVTAVPAGASVNNTQQQQQQQSTIPPTQATPATVIINVRRP
jgi:TolB-like protein